MLKKTMKLVLLPAAAAVLVACGGGASNNGGGTSPQSVVISGTAAVGAPIEAGSITVYDATGAVVGSGNTGAGGVFSVTLPTKGVAPYTLKLAKDEIVLHAIHTDASSGVSNITPLSDAVAAFVSPTGAAEGLVAALQNNAVAPTKELVQEKRQIITTALSPVSSAVGVTADIFTSAFVANGKGQDKLLDSISVVSNAANGTVKTANVQFVVKVATDPENPASQLPVVNLTSRSSLADANVERVRLGVLNANELTPDNASVLYTGLIANLNACYRDLPTVRTDGASAVLSAPCKKVVS